MARFLPQKKKKQRKYKYCRSCKTAPMKQNKNNLTQEPKILKIAKVIEDRKKALEERRKKYYNKEIHSIKSKEEQLN
jgi:hypothetical protein